MKEIYDLIIIGAGPAGMTSSIYASRANMSVLMLEKKYPGGQMLSTADIENYTGYEEISGPDLSEKMFEHSKKFGTEFAFGEISSVEIEENNIKVLNAGDKQYKAKSVIIATGTEAKLLGIPGEQEFASRGVSYCAVCDGAFFRNKEVVVIGGGDSAIEEAIYLSNIVNKVTIVHRRDELRAQKILQERAFQKSNIEFVWDSIPVEIKGERTVNSIIVKNVKTEETKEIVTNGVFIYIGMNPQTEIFKDLGILDNFGYIPTDEHLATKLPGVFVAGDARQKEIRQIVTAANDGAIAAQSAYKYCELSI
ncbi:thioredoxin-disulfide reductase [Gemella sp. GH3]|uniref:thioredoxin-disulfide reductase n=1 Tax=unclassified Gemella TaxID=2624949 RepID=UPI0015CFCB14|nr:MULTISPECIES: thioredoxin-disulfide reductase [unclassified Gemella]MBF0713309.1 thioredoxin-disulfide reductase [Gemella sp. GH3.1]NYS50261.1 thioredoxin-disulfide reductase [Gemella sp. GH3]